MIQEVYNTFAECLAPFGRVVIAGGSVRDSLMGRDPKDYDIFILGGNGIAYNDIAIKVERLLAKYKKIESETDWHKSEPFLIYQLEYEGKEVQVMYKEELFDTGSLIDGFDWNVSLFAYDERGYHQREDIENIAAGKFLKLQKVTYPSSTLRRGFRFSERFKMQIDKGDLAKLCSQVSFGYNKKSIPSI